MSDLFINADDIGKVILDYIASDEFGRGIREDDRNGFITGLGFAGTLIYARCRKYIQMEKEEKDDECFWKDLQNAYDDGYKARDAEIVRCKDCKWFDVDSDGIFCEQYGRVPKDDWFCADGVRKEC